MEMILKISNLNDFIFCPASIYYHGMYEDVERNVYQEKAQLAGTFAHKTVDKGKYSTRKDILQGIEVYSERYKIQGKIDIYEGNTKTLIERKNKITTIYDGYIFQIYAQYYGMTEMGYEIEKLKIYSFSDNKTYPIKLPDDDLEMKKKFENLFEAINTFELSEFRQNNIEKCKRCIYAPLCVQGGENVNGV
ncbi:MAG: type V CRISPR-associated protein Cas4 [Clostridioides sp.]|jgi:CRISPR-associated protein Cas4|nr:type V CRISPR-associated protein Cas4 [Clostridioides sp.]